MSSDYDEIEIRARDYYDSGSADAFYHRVWGGVDIHVGIYASESESIAAASRRTVERMASRLHRWGGSRLVDLGSGYGGPARYLAERLGFEVTCLNLSEVQNARNRRRNRRRGLAERVRVVEGSFEAMPFDDGEFDLAWSEDALVHSGDRRRALSEVERVLRPGGEFLFTDLMQSPSCPPEALAPILERIHLDSLGSFAGYRATARRLGWQELAVVDLSSHLAVHYARVLQELEERWQELAASCGRDYLEAMKTGLGHWIDGGRAGHLEWGILHFRKPAASSNSVVW